MDSHIDRIIKQLGYVESGSLRYRRDGYVFDSISSHYSRVLDELSPYATYMIDNTPFILFFEEAIDLNKQKRLNTKIWNAQIPLVIICGTGDVKIYNGTSIDKQSEMLREVSRISLNELDERSPFSYWEITNADLWRAHLEKFEGKRLNDFLLENLEDITNKIKKHFRIPFATKLILRLIFIRYLIDRGVDIDYAGFSTDVGSSRTAFLQLLTNKEGLYDLFFHLKKKFNGNLFEVEDELDNENMSQDVLDLLYDFFSANMNTKTGQRSLFNLYDFNIIPVELISNIYEILLGDDSRKKDNAFYTPQYLVDYILNYSVNSFVKDNGTCTVLDPSCGSGIFLVESYRRMIETALAGKLYTDDDTILKETLCNNIYGIDKNIDAIDVTIFSLYLAMLDYKNPRTLSHFNLPFLKGTNLFAADFFDEQALEPLKVISFDFIIGNPPWGKDDGFLLEYCKRKRYTQYLQNNDTCRAFILRSKDFSNKNTHCTFVLHSTLLYMQKSPSVRFRGYLLNYTIIERIVELSSVRNQVFKNANAPAVIISYRYSDDSALQNYFEYISMKPNIFFRLFNIIVVDKTDIKHVQQRLLKEYDWAWKTLVYGFSSDIDNIIRLKKEFQTLSNAISLQSPTLVTGTGVQYNDGDLNDAGNLFGRPLLETEAVDHFSINIEMQSSFDKKRIHRARNEKLFQAPYCLVRRGLDMNNYTMRSAYSEEDFVYKEALYGIKGYPEQKDFLLNTVGLFNSNAYAYFNLMLDSSLGVEREQRQVKEVLNFPYVYSAEIAQCVYKIQKIKKQKPKQDIEADLSSEIVRLNELVLSSFGLEDNEFVEYALQVQIPMLTEDDAHTAYRRTNNGDFEVYAKYLYDYLSPVFEETGKYIRAIAYPTFAHHYSAVQIVVHETPATEWFCINKDSDDTLLLRVLSEHKINDTFYYIKNTLYFSDSSFLIVKPNYYKNWHPAIAKLDLMEVIGQILSRDGGDI